MSPEQPQPVLVTRGGALGRITLNRPEVINALTLEMFGLIDAALDEFAADPEVGCVLLDGAGERGFCAGGDVVGLRQTVANADWRTLADFYRVEYRLNARISHFPKPVVGLMDGITMGGGVGLTGHASHRIVTERSRVAMPEVRIGLSPDVGGTFLLSRAPGQLGTHLALTAATASGADAIITGLADHFITSDQIPDLIDRLSTGDVGLALDAVWARPPASGLAAARRWIDPAYAGDDPERIVARLRACPDPAAHDAAAAIATKSPTAVAVALRAVREARKLRTLEQCLALEFRTVLALLALPDFSEGIRAALIDKDQNPRWSPGRLGKVQAADLDRCFAPRPEGELTFPAGQTAIG